MFHPKLLKNYPFDSSWRLVNENCGEGRVEEFLGSISQIAGLVHLPKSFFRELTIKGRRSVAHHCFVDSIVLYGLVGKLIRHEVESLEQGVSHLAKEEEHEPCSSIEVPDGDFPQKQVRESVAKTNFLESPLSPESVIAFTGMVLVNIFTQIILRRNLQLARARTLRISLMAVSESSRKNSCLFLTKMGVQFSSSQLDDWTRIEDIILSSNQSYHITEFCTCSSLVLNQSLALPSLIGICCMYNYIQFC